MTLILKRRCFGATVVLKVARIWLASVPLKHVQAKAADEGGRTASAYSTRRADEE